MAHDQAHSEEASEGKASPPKGQDTVLVPGVSGHPREKDRKKRDRQDAKRTEQLDKSDYVSNVIF